MNQVKCNLCGSARSRLLFFNLDRLLKTDTRRFAVVRCLSCGLVYLNPQPTAKELRQYYPENYGPYGRKGMFKYGPVSRFLKWFFLTMRKSRHEPRQSDALESTPGIEPAQACLDFGCGNGTFLEGLRQAHPNWELYGLDNSEIACQRTREKGFKVYCGDILETDLPENFFDQVYMNSVIEHLNDPRAALLRLKRSMKPGAAVEIRTPNIGSLAAQLFGRFWYALDTPRHLYLFTPATLGRLLRETGFEVKKIGYKSGMSVEIKSFYYLVGKKDRRMNPIVWRLLLPLNRFLMRFGLASTMIIRAVKEKGY